MTTEANQALRTVVLSITTATPEEAATVHEMLRIIRAGLNKGHASDDYEYAHSYYRPTIVDATDAKIIDSLMEGYEGWGEDEQEPRIVENRLLCRSLRAMVDGGHASAMHDCHPASPGD